MQNRAFLEILNKCSWFPILKKIITDAGISSNPDEYMYDILWGDGSNVKRDVEDGLEIR